MFPSSGAIVISISVFRVYGQVTYADPLESCTTEGPVLGNAVFCCSGACLDGTRIGEPGQCDGWLNLCIDIDSPPACAYNQVLSYRDPPTVDSGDGCCGACCCECQWQRNDWSWSCCDCPEGFIAVDVGTCGGTANPGCVGCQGHDQTLTGDPTTGFQCVASGTSSSESALPTSDYSDTSETPDTATPDTSENPATSGPPPSASSDTCQDLQTASDRLGVIGTVSTWLGAVCAANFDPLSVTTSLLENAYAFAKAYKAPQTGFFGNSAGLASTLVSTISSVAIDAAAVALAPEEVTVASGLALSYAVACDANGFVGTGAFYSEVALDQEINARCTSKITKRFWSSIGLHTERRRDVDNPCAEFLSYFPSNYSAPAMLNSTCDEIISDPSSLDTIPGVEKACQDYQNSGNGTILTNFATMLQALQDFVPYCTQNSTLVSSGSSTTSSMSAPAQMQSAIPSSSNTDLEDVASATVGGGRAQHTYAGPGGWRPWRGNMHGHGSWSDEDEGDNWH